MADDLTELPDPDGSNQLPVPSEFFEEGGRSVTDPKLDEQGRVETFKFFRCPECGWTDLSGAHVGANDPKQKCNPDCPGSKLEEVTAFIPSKGVHLVGLTEEDADAFGALDDALTAIDYRGEAGDVEELEEAVDHLRSIFAKLPAALSQEES